MNQKTKKYSGFTLLELLIVIAIIGILSTVTVVNMTIVRAKARDAQRISILSQLITGMETFYSYYGLYPCGDHNDGVYNPDNGTYDSSNSGGACGGGDPTENVPGFLNGCATTADPSCDIVGTNNYCAAPPYGGLLTENISNTNCPQDPLGPSSLSDSPKFNFVYHVTEDRQSYVIFAYLETGSNAMLNDGGRCSRLYEVGNAVGYLLPWQDGVGTNDDGCS